MSAPAEPAGVVGTLQQLGARLADSGHPLQAVKCFTALLGQSLLPADEAAARLRIAQLLLDATLNAAEAKQHLHKAVSTPA